MSFYASPERSKTSPNLMLLRVVDSFTGAGLLIFYRNNRMETVKVEDADAGEMAKIRREYTQIGAPAASCRCSSLFGQASKN